MTTEIDRPRRLRVGRTLGDRVFRGTARGLGTLVLLVMGGIGIFLAIEATPAFREFGLGFFTTVDWNPEARVLGIAAVLVGTITVATIAMIVAFPLALGTALYISQYAAPKAKRWLIAMVDLMASVPSVIYGLFGAYLLQPEMVYVSRWLHDMLGFIPVFQVDTDPDAAVFAQSRYAASALIAALVVAMMVLPYACMVMREVFDQAPQGEREAAYALGSTRWGMVRSVVLPFGRGGIIGGTMLALGRALGETIAVVLIIAPLFEVKVRILENGTITVPALIATRYGESVGIQLAGLLAAGLVLFVITLVTNSIAAVIVTRSRSGADTEI
ncbi:phosphate ABC transporter permease subunit PstC [Actinophytocola oryzae]|uniref:Phosphate transport system permease protein n=1 Tax=Actinophytocola oryzae TaxID=502181 RepID=A0A4R7VUK1_9PSEU|nr:phosphate ABC transporter permease subunit PstC [Actinophytocola oryzae]TDV53650.1 phosphate ABC transporter membrane protein 1 (PhoT family) [Actinophytocola oryzae]